MAIKGKVIGGTAITQTGLKEIGSGYTLPSFGIADLAYVTVAMNPIYHTTGGEVNRDATGYLKISSPFFSEDHEYIIGDQERLTILPIEEDVPGGTELTFEVSIDYDSGNIDSYVAVGLVYDQGDTPAYGAGQALKSKFLSHNKDASAIDSSYTIPSYGPADLEAWIVALGLNQDTLTNGEWSRVHKLTLDSPVISGDQEYLVNEIGRIQEIPYPLGVLGGSEFKYTLTTLDTAGEVATGSVGLRYRQ